MTLTVDEKLTEELRDIYDRLGKSGDISSRAQLTGYYDRFRRRFGPAMLNSLAGELL